MTLRAPLVLKSGKLAELPSTDALSPGYEGRMHSVLETVFAGQSTGNFTNGQTVTYDGVDYAAVVQTGATVGIVASGLKLTGNGTGGVESNFAFKTGQNGIVGLIGQERFRRGRFGIWHRIASYDWSAGTASYAFLGSNTNYPNHGAIMGRARNTQGCPNTAAGGVFCQTWWNGSANNVATGTASDDVQLLYWDTPFRCLFLSGTYSGGWPDMENMTVLAMANLLTSVNLAASASNFKDGSTWCPYWVAAANNAGMNWVIDRWRVTVWP